MLSLDIFWVIFCLDAIWLLRILAEIKFPDRNRVHRRRVPAITKGLADYTPLFRYANIVSWRRLQLPFQRTPFSPVLSREGRRYFDKFPPGFDGKSSFLEAQRPELISPPDQPHQGGGHIAIATNKKNLFTRGQVTGGVGSSIGWS